MKLRRRTGKLSTAKVDIIWSPQPGPQVALVRCPVFEVCFGGARGGGKTDSMIGGDWPRHAQKYGKHAKGVFFRRTMPQLEAAIERSQQLYYRLGARWLEQKKTWIFPNGAILKFRQLECDSDAEKYQGHDYTRLYFEELTNYPSPKPVDKLKATLRSGAGVPCGFRATCNPGGPGHNWVKERYIDPAPQGYKILRDDNNNQRVFIPAKISDNKILTQQDPGYVDRLHLSGSEQLVKAWLDGDWNVIDGAFFDCWSSSMVIDPVVMPAHWLRFRSFDWGSSKPFSVGWWAVVGDTFNGIPRGAMIRYREWYGKSSANVGLKLTAAEVAKGIADREKGDKVGYGVADPAIFTADGGPSIAEMMQPHGVYWKPADNKRVAAVGRVGGWDQMRGRMKGDGEKPMIYCFKTCADSIRTIPMLQHDENHPEDLDTSAEDHAADEWRYACMSRPWVAQQRIVKEPTRDLWGRRVRKKSNWQTS